MHLIPVLLDQYQVQHPHNLQKFLDLAYPLQGGHLSLHAHHHLQNLNFPTQVQVSLLGLSVGMFVKQYPYLMTMKKCWTMTTAILISQS
jgi:hypothetical protein